MYAKLGSVLDFRHTDNAEMTGTCGGKEVKYKEMDLLFLDILGKDRPVEGLGSDDCVRAEEAVTDSNRSSHVHQYWWLIYPHHVMSEMKTGIYTILYSDASRVFLYYKQVKICYTYTGLRNTRHVTY